jgi:dipeptidase E
MQKLLLASTSTLYNGNYLEYLLPELKKLYLGCSEILFIPFARPGGISHIDYTERVKKTFAAINIHANGIHEYEDPIKAIKEAGGYFTGGGNTFVLVNALHEKNLMSVLSKEIASGKPYFGSSAGSNIAGQTMQTTNDMPIVYPPTFKTLGLIPFNLNPHYLDADLQSKHMGETRATRIKEFHAYNNLPVLGLREGSWLDVTGSQITLKGALNARLFRKDQEAIELQPGDITDSFAEN